MAIHYVVPLVAAIIYITLFFVTFFNRPWQRQHKQFMVYMVAATLWGISDALLRSNLLMDYKLLLFRAVTITSIWWAVQFYHFIRGFLHLPWGWGLKFGYASLGLFVILAALGIIPPSVTVESGVVSPEYGWWFVLYVVPLLSMASLGVLSLIMRWRHLTDPEERNKIGYLIAAIGLLAVFGFIGITPLAQGFPISHIGGLLSAIILTYAVVKHEMMSINLVLRRSLGIASLALVGMGSYLLMLFLVHLSVGFKLDGITAASATAVALLAFLLVFRLRPFLMGKVEQLFYRQKYRHRQELSDFVRYKISRVFSLKELSEGLLPPLVKVLDCQRAYMLLPETATGDFVVRFTEPTMEANPSLRIKHDSPIVKWLNEEYLTHETLDILPEFRGLWEKEREELKTLDIEMFFPLVSRDNLIGILALGQKQTGKYSLEDANLMEEIASQVAISLEKEHLQGELRKREQELALINRLTAVMTSSLNIQEVFNSFVEGLKEVVDVSFAALALTDNRELHFPALSSEIDTPWQTGDSIPLKGTATEWVVRNKKSLMEPDLALDRMFSLDEEFLRQGIRSIANLPLVTKDEAIGSLSIASHQPEAYDPAQMNLLERLASQIATSVVNAQLYNRAEQRARIDELTGLYNRRHFDEILKLEINRHSRYGSTLSLAFLDLDNFKSYNDTMGHLAGDKLLAEISQSVSGTLRSIDLAFRYGGDEFSIILPHTSPDDAFTVAERVRQRVVNTMENQQVMITASLGVASWPNDGLTQDNIIDAADKALYYAKRTGGNRTCTVSQLLPSLSEPMESAPAVEKETLSTIYALAATIEARDPYTYGHSRKVRGYAVALAEALNLPSEKVAIVSHAALLHDIGKIGIIDEILKKPSSLNANEWDLIKSHPQLSRTIVGHIPSLTPCLPAILHHHERWDGTGYPDGLKELSIPLEARILSVADSFDAMTSARPYRAPLLLTEAIAELKRSASGQFDPSLIETFLGIVHTVIPEELALRENQ